MDARHTIASEVVSLGKQMVTADGLHVLIAGLSNGRHKRPTSVNVEPMGRERTEGRRSK